MSEAIWGAHVLDTFVAPRLSTFTNAAIPDMSSQDSQQERWSANYLLNTAMSTRFRAPLRQQVTNALRHTQSAFSSYALAREATNDYLSASPRPMLYLRSIGHWEDFLAHAWQAYNFIGRGKKDMFVKADGSVIQRLYDLNARARHAAEAIERAGTDEAAPTITVWLENDGLHSGSHVLTFVECSAALIALAHLANAMQDPAAMRETLERIAAGDDSV
ncbi:hexokinase [Marmoricola sp. URHA0025 HA25]